MIHVFIGTKAQYIKTAPLLRLMDRRQVPYRLVDSGQHARFAAELRRELAVRDPDLLLGGSEDVVSIPQAAAWSLRLALELVSARRLRRGIFGDQGGVCVVHGDTPSTMLSALMARRAGLPVAHLEAGLRSDRILHPFPEELIRRAVMRLSRILFAPDQVAVANLRRLRLRGHIVPLSGNTSVEALAFALGDAQVADTGSVIATMHRVENLHRRKRVEGFVRLLERIARQRAVLFVLHEPTARALQPSQRLRLETAGVKMQPLVGHAIFARLLAEAPYVVTDGGSIQEECAVLGVPTLLWRDRTERPDGIGTNVVLSHYDGALCDGFLADPGRLRRPFQRPEVSPSEQVLEVLLSSGER